MDYADWDDEPFYGDEDLFEEDFDFAPLERWEDDCGYDPAFEGICHHAGTEDCSFFCPFHNVYFNNAPRAED